jgi:hypothetical protein
MADFKILGVYDQDCHLVVRVEHHHADGSFWFIENYVHDGREGIRQKRKVNGAGLLLMDDGNVAPLVNPDPPTRKAGKVRMEDTAQYLPEGRTWDYHPAPWMDENSVLSVIRDIHGQRLVTGFPQGQVDSAERMSHTDEDERGCEALVNKFLYLVGREFDV